MRPQEDWGAEGRQRHGNRVMVSAALRWATLLDYFQLGMTDAPREAEPGADAPEGPQEQPTP